MSDPGEATRSPSRVERVRHEVRCRELQVQRVEPLGGEFVRAVFGGEALVDFVSLGFDDHVKFFVEVPGTEPARRDYTPRRFDRERRELTIDFALHGEGAAAGWARQAAPGQRVTIAGPRGSMIVPLDYAWHLLIGDATAAPGIGRRLAELPAGARAIVVVELADDAPLELAHSAAQVQLQRVASAEALVAAVAALALPPGEGYAWGAGEASVMARVREHLVAKGHPREAMRVAAYWKRGASQYHDELGG